MFNNSALSKQPIVAPEFHGVPELQEEPDVKTAPCPDLKLVRTPSASPPRLRGVDADDDGDLMIPDILRKPAGVLVDRPLDDAGSSPEAAGFVHGSVAAASVAGLLLVVAGGLMFYAAGGTSGRDVGTVPVKTISIEGQTSANAIGRTAGGSDAGVQTHALDRSGFDARFNSAKAADPDPGALKIKRQDRLSKTPLEKTGADSPVTAKAAAGHSGTGASLPVLGYAAAPNPHVGWDDGQTVISSAAGQPSLKEARVAAAKPAAVKSEPPPEPAAVSGKMTETSTITADVNLRSAAEKDAAVLTVVPKGTSVAVGSCDNWWCAVSFDGRSGFVGKKFVDGKG